MFGKNKKEQNDVDKYLSKKQRKAMAFVVTVSTLSPKKDIWNR